jgi:hypothetical protein
MVNRRDSAWISLAAACALVMHLFLAGFVGAALAADAPVVICSPSPNASFPGSNQSERHRAPDCCLAGCPMVGGMAGAPVAALFIPPEGHVTPLPPAPRHGLDPLRKWSPANPRGPPPAA